MGPSFSPLSRTSSSGGSANWKYFVSTTPTLREVPSSKGCFEIPEFFLEACLFSLTILSERFLGTISFSSSRGFLQGLINVFLDILYILQTNGKPDEIFC